jgi:thiol-disulfide isomerase/thioredoxin
MPAEGTAMTRSSMTKPFATIPLVLVILAGAAGIYWFNAGQGKVESPVATATPAQGSLKPLATGALAAFLVAEPRKEIAAFNFKDASGTDVDLNRWKGRVVLLNLWATWCAPCRKEMPDLANLQKQVGGDDFEVVALSIDRKGAEASAAFLKEVGVDNLALYTDVESKSLAALQALGLPATVLIDRKGQEAGRLLGPAKWDGPEAQALVKALLAETP